MQLNSSTNEALILGIRLWKLAYFNASIMVNPEKCFYITPLFEVGGSTVACHVV